MFEVWRTGFISNEKRSSLIHPLFSNAAWKGYFKVYLSFARLYRVLRILELFYRFQLFNLSVMFVNFVFDWLARLGGPRIVLILKRGNKSWKVQILACYFQASTSRRSCVMFVNFVFDWLARLGSPRDYTHAKRGKELITHKISNKYISFQASTSNTSCVMFVNFVFDWLANL